jgi:hypothetical protein
MEAKKLNFLIGVFILILASSPLRQTCPGSKTAEKKGQGPIPTIQPSIHILGMNDQTEKKNLKSNAPQEFHPRRRAARRVFAASSENVDVVLPSSMSDTIQTTREMGDFSTLDRSRSGSSKSQSLFAAAVTYPYLKVRFLNHSLFCRAEFRELGSSSPGLGRAATPCKPRLNWREPPGLRRSFTGDAYKSRGFGRLKLEGQRGDCKCGPAMDKPAQPCQADIGMFMSSL